MVAIGTMLIFVEYTNFFDKTKGRPVGVEAKDFTPKNKESMNKAQVFGKSKINAFLVVLVCSFVWCQATQADTVEKRQNQNTNASATNLDLQELISSFANVKSVSLSMIQPFTESRAAKTESQVEQSECLYVTGDSPLVADMVDIIKNGGVHAYWGPKESWEPSEVMLLTLANGDRVKFVFGWPFLAEKEIHGSINNAPVLVKLSLIYDLYGWAKKIKKIPSCNDWLGRNITRKF
ncbi:hypothetical protein AAKU61_000216 [Undibacterium sp. GrIS 1.2]|uniref:hypothetical protein n=1 Tax=Undibacterium sp. GrIS 1.2 TaxID=3143933 RepID=UPI003398B2D6